MRGPSGLIAGVIGLVVGALVGAGLALLTAPEPTEADLEALASDLLGGDAGVRAAVASGELVEGLLDPPATVDGATRGRAEEADWRDLELEPGVSLSGSHGIQRFELEPTTLALRYRAGDLVVPSAGLGAVTGAVALASVAVLGRRRPDGSPSP